MSHHCRIYFIKHYNRKRSSEDSEIIWNNIASLVIWLENHMRPKSRPVLWSDKTPHSQCGAIQHQYSQPASHTGVSKGSFLLACAVLWRKMLHSQSSCLPSTWPWGAGTQQGLPRAVCIRTACLAHTGGGSRVAPWFPQQREVGELLLLKNKSLVV